MSAACRQDRRIGRALGCILFAHSDSSGLLRVRAIASFLPCSLPNLTLSDYCFKLLPRHAVHGRLSESYLEPTSIKACDTLCAGVHSAVPFLCSYYEWFSDFKPELL